MKNKIESIIIRTETPNDFPKVYNLHTEAFATNREAQLVDSLRASESFIQELSMVATIDNEVVGHILFSRVNIVSPNSKHSSVALSPMAVSPKYQNLGVGTKLVIESLSKAKQLGYDSVIVLGHTHFYPKFNFKPASLWGIKAPFHVPNDAFMALELIPDALNQVAGTVEYLPELDVL